MLSKLSWRRRLRELISNGLLVGSRLCPHFFSVSSPRPSPTRQETAHSATTESKQGLPYMIGARTDIRAPEHAMFLMRHLGYQMADPKLIGSTFRGGLILKIQRWPDIFNLPEAKIVY